MSNIKISELGQAGALTGQELIPLVQDNLTLRTTTSQLKAFAGIAISNDIIADEASTTMAPSVNAIKSYADGLVMGLVDDRGNFTPSPALPGGFPTLNGSGAGGQIMKGDLYFIDNTGYINGVAVTAGQSIRALADNPLQDPTKWNILSAGLIQSTLQNVLNAGRIATGTNASITLSDTGYNLILYPQNMGVYYNAGGDNYRNVLAPTFSELKNVFGGNRIFQNVLGSNCYLSVKNGTTNNYSQLNSDGLQFYKDSFLNNFNIATITTSQTWTLPNASGTIALTNNIWNATGNAGTVAGANFLGTIDTVDLVIKTNNLERIRVASSGSVIINDLAGTGTRTVVADSTGKLSTSVSSSAWSTLGNANTSPLTNFIGTTDNNDVIFKRNNLEFLRLDGTFGLTTNQNITSKGTYPNITASSVIASNRYVSLSYDSTISATAGHIQFGNNGIIAYLKADNIATSDKIFQLPNASGTIALTDTVTLQNVTSGTSKNLVDGINLQGTNAGLNTTGTITNVNAFGNGAMVSNTISSNHINAFGFNAAANSANTSNVNAIGVNAASNNSNTNYVNAMNKYAARGNSGSNINAFGYQAAQNNTAGDINALGTNAALNNQGQYTNAIGNQSAVSNTGIHVNGIGQYAAYNNEGNYVNGLGIQAAQSNTGANLNALGYTAGGSNTGDHVNGIGYSACQNNIGDYVNGIGANAAESNHGIYVNALGWEAAKTNTGNDVNAFGTGAGYGNTISGATIFSNASLPSYANYAAAAAAITVLLGATANCTYLYHDQATNSIGAVRL